MERGSKPAEAGVRSALRFWLMESSMVPREIRRKSGKGGRGEIGLLVGMVVEHLGGSGTYGIGW